MCWPINTLIQPGSNYSLELQAQNAVLQALTWDVSNSSLQLSTNSSFRSLYPIVAIVRLAPSFPAAAIKLLVLLASEKEVPQVKSMSWHEGNDTC